MEEEQQVQQYVTYTSDGLQDVCHMVRSSGIGFTSFWAMSLFNPWSGLWIFLLVVLIGSIVMTGKTMLNAGNIDLSGLLEKGDDGATDHLR